MERKGRGLTPEAPRETIQPMEDSNLRAEETPDPFGFLPGASPFDAWRHRRFPALRPIDFIGGDRPPAVNLLVSRFDRNGLSLETPRTLRFAGEVCRRSGAGLRLITLDGPCQPDFLAELPGIEVLAPERAEFFDGSVRHTRDTYRRLVVGADDLFMATDWGSSRIARFLNLRRRFVWIIQSCEPDGLPEGDGRDLVVESMRDFSDFVPVFASAGLAERLAENGWIGGEGPRLVLPPEAEAPHAPGGNAPSPDGKRVLLIGEGRGYRPARALEGVDRAIRAGILSTEDWRIVLSGAGNGDPPPGYARGSASSGGRNPGAAGWSSPAFCDGGRAELPEPMDFRAGLSFLRRVDLGVFAGPWVHDDPALAEIRAAGGRIAAGSFANAGEVARRIGEVLAGPAEPRPAVSSISEHHSRDGAADAVAGMFRASGDHVPSV